MAGEHLARLVTELEARLERGGETRSKLRTVLSLCGYRRRSAGALANMEAALRTADIYARPRLTDTDLDHDTFIEFSRVPYSSFQHDMLFSGERDLQAFMVVNYRRIEALHNLKQPRVEYPLPSGARIDLLFRERVTK